MNYLETIVAGFKSQIGEGIEQALKFLEQYLDPQSPRFDDFIQIKGRYNSLQRELLLGTIDQNTYNHWRNSLSQALLLFAGELTEVDLKTEKTAVHPRDDKRGNILYYIPHRMLLNREEKCAVRLAWLEEALLRDWMDKEEDVRREIRMSEIMAVELLNLDERQPFQIRSLSEAVQFVDNEDYTEWVFYVKPLLEGEFALVLRVSVIEIIRDKEYKKDIVLEERVQVQTQELPQPAPAPFKPVHAVLAVGNTAPESRSPSVAPAAAIPAATRPGSEEASPETQPSVLKTSGQTVVRQVIIGLAASVTLITAISVGLPYYREAQAWKKARSCGRPQCAKAYLEKYPDGRYKDEALIMLSDTVLLDQDSITWIPPIDRPAIDSVLPPGNRDDFIPLPDDTVTFSLAAWEKAQARASRKPESRPDAPATSAVKTESNDPDLHGEVVKLKVPEFPIVQSDTGLLNFRFLKLNTNKEGFAMLHNLNGKLFRPGQQIEFVTSGGKVHRSSVQYVAVDPYRGNVARISRAYFRLDEAAVKAFATKKITQIRVVNPVTQTTDIYPTTRQTQQELNRRTRAALEAVTKGG